MLAKAQRDADLAYRQRIKNSAALRVALIQHVFTVTLPAPQPLHHADDGDGRAHTEAAGAPLERSRCFWRQQEMRY